MNSLTVIKPNTELPTSFGGELSTRLKTGERIMTPKEWQRATNPVGTRSEKTEMYHEYVKSTTKKATLLQDTINRNEDKVLVAVRPLKNGAIWEKRVPLSHLLKPVKKADPAEKVKKAEEKMKDKIRKQMRAAGCSEELIAKTVV